MTGKYTSGLNRCQCHPETCCCKDYAVYGPDGEKVETFSTGPMAASFADHLNEQKSKPVEPPASLEVVHPRPLVISDKVRSDPVWYTLRHRVKGIDKGHTWNTTHLRVRSKAHFSLLVRHERPSYRGWDMDVAWEGDVYLRPDGSMEVLQTQPRIIDPITVKDGQMYKRLRQVLVDAIELDRREMTRELLERQDRNRRNQELKRLYREQFGEDPPDDLFR